MYVNHVVINLRDQLSSQIIQKLPVDMKVTTIVSVASNTLKPRGTLIFIKEIGLYGTVQDSNRFGAGKVATDYQYQVEG